ncbi:MAG: hypothetical protein WCT77_09050 [Bacteroidota bacterium]
MESLIKIINCYFVRILPTGIAKILFRFTPQNLAWIIHLRDMDDIERKIPILKKLPFFIKKLLTTLIPPYKVSEFSENNSLIGYIIVIPLLPAVFKKNKWLSRLRTNQAFRLAKKMGAVRVSVGGMLSKIVETENLGEKYGVSIFDGTELLAVAATEKVLKFINENQTGIKSIGIIGATTKSGKKLSQNLASKFNGDIHLYAKTEKNVQLLSEECKKLGVGNIYSHVNFESLGDCDLCVLTSFIYDQSSNLLVKNIKKDSVLLSIIEPVSPFVFDLQRMRPDIKVVRGIKIETPTLSYDDIDFVINKGSAYACLTEALLDNNRNNNELNADLQSLLKNNNYKIA